MKYEENLSELIKETSEKIENIKKKYVYSYLGFFLGAMIILIALAYLIINQDVATDIFGGVLSLTIIGVVVIVINFVQYSRRKKRVEQLTHDVMAAKEKMNENN